MAKSIKNTPICYLMRMPTKKLNSGTIIQATPTFRKGFAVTNFVLWDNPIPKTAVEVVCVIDKGMLKSVATSNRNVEVINVAVASA